MEKPLFKILIPVKKKKIKFKFATAEDLDSSQNIVFKKGWRKLLDGTRRTKAGGGRLSVKKRLENIIELNIRS